jgi:hypothetical protein
MAAIRLEGEELVVRLNDLEKAGAFRGDVRVPVAAIRAARVTERPFREIKGLRAPGTGFPGVIALGTWRYSGGKDFVAVYRGGPAVVVELEGAAFSRLIVSEQDAAAVAASLAPPDVTLH